MKTVWKMLYAVTLAQLAFAAVAFAFDLPPTGTPIPATDAQAFDLFGSLWQFFVTKNYAAAIGPALTLAIWALRKYDAQIPKVGPAIDKFLNQPMVAFLLPTVISGLGGGVTALATGHSFVDALNAVWATSSTAIATYIGLKKLGEQQAAGQAAADDVKTKADAVAAIAQAAADEAKKAPPAPGA